MRVVVALAGNAVLRRGAPPGGCDPAPRPHDGGHGARRPGPRIRWFAPATLGRTSQPVPPTVASRAVRPLVVGPVVRSCYTQAGPGSSDLRGVWPWCSSTRGTMLTMGGDARRRCSQEQGTEPSRGPCSHNARAQAFLGMTSGMGSTSCHERGRGAARRRSAVAQPRSWSGSCMVHGVRVRSTRRGVRQHGAGSGLRDAGRRAAGGRDE